MQTDSSKNRWLVVVGALLVQFNLGAIYAWSVFAPVLKNAGWSNTETQYVFSVALVSFAIVMLFAGRLMKEIGPRKLTAIGGVLLGTGYIIPGLLGATNFWIVLLGIGVISGSGIGLAYVVPIAVGMRWFPDKKGFITGLSVAGFGFGAMGWVKMAGTWGKLLETQGLDMTFMIYGTLFIILTLIGSLWMTFPQQGWKPKGYVAPRMAEGGNNYTVAEMLRTPQFYLLFIVFAVSAGAGLMAIGLMKLYPTEALQASGYSAADASAIAGTTMGVFFALANGIGRIVWGKLTDMLGTHMSMIVMTATQTVFVFAFPSMAGHEYMLYLGATLIGFNYGGVFALVPATTAALFGTEKVGQNYPYVFLAYGLGGLTGPLLGGVLGDLGNFPLAFSICGAGCLAGVICIFLMRKPEEKMAEQPA